MSVPYLIRKDKIKEAFNTSMSAKTRTIRVVIIGILFFCISNNFGMDFRNFSNGYLSHAKNLVISFFNTAGFLRYNALLALARLYMRAGPRLYL